MMRRNLMKKDRKGIADTLTIAIVLFVIGFLGIISYKIISGMNVVIQSSDVNNNES